MEPISDNEVEVRRHDSGDDDGYRSDEAEEDPETRNDDEDGEGEKGRRIDPSTSKRKVVRNPQPKLNAERIQGPKGVQTLEQYFDGFKFHGRGHEKNDLDRVMKRLEHWAHRLFPKYQFDDFLEKMETLGSKKNVQVFLKKYRLGMITPDDDVADLQDEDKEMEDEQVVPQEAPEDEFDKLIAEQIEKQRQISIEPLKQTNKPVGYVLGYANTTESSEMSEEIRARIEANRQLAMERKMARLKREEESRKRKLEEAQLDAQISNAIKVISMHENVEGARNVGPSNENVVVEVISREAEEKTQNFHVIGENNVAEEEPKKRRILGAVIEDISSAEEEEQPDRIEIPAYKKRLPDLLHVEPQPRERVVISHEDETTRNEGPAQKKRLPDLLPANEEMLGRITVKYGEELSERAETPKYKDHRPRDLPIARIEVQDHEAVQYDYNGSEDLHQERSLPKVNGHRRSHKKPRSPLTHEQLLMEIDGAMEEIINRSARRST